MPLWSLCFPFSRPQHRTNGGTDGNGADTNIGGHAGTGAVAIPSSTADPARVLVDPQGLGGQYAAPLAPARSRLARLEFPPPLL
jgi:hypothetical protein